MNGVFPDKREGPPPHEGENSNEDEPQKHRTQKKATQLVTGCVGGGVSRVLGSGTPGIAVFVPEERVIHLRAYGGPRSSRRRMMDARAVLAIGPSAGVATKRLDTPVIEEMSQERIGLVNLSHLLLSERLGEAVPASVVRMVSLGTSFESTPDVGHAIALGKAKCPLRL